jgi:hypothetical protein
MIQCEECKAYFFLQESLREHNNYCIGYEVKDGEREV